MQKAMRIDNNERRETVAGKESIKKIEIEKRIKGEEYERRKAKAKVGLQGIKDNGKTEKNKVREEDKGKGKETIEKNPSGEETERSDRGNGSVLEKAGRVGSESRGRQPRIEVRGDIQIDSRKWELKDPKVRIRLQ